MDIRIAYANTPSYYPAIYNGVTLMWYIFGGLGYQIVSSDWSELFLTKTICIRDIIQKCLTWILPNKYWEYIYISNINVASEVTAITTDVSKVYRILIICGWAARRTDRHSWFHLKLSESDILQTYVGFSVTPSLVFI